MIGLVWVMMCIIQFDSLEVNILFLKVLYSLFGAILFRIQDHLESAEFCPEKRDKIYVKTQWKWTLLMMTINDRDRSHNINNIFFLITFPTILRNRWCFNFQVSGRKRAANVCGAETFRMVIIFSSEHHRNVCVWDVGNSFHVALWIYNNAKHVMHNRYVWLCSWSFFFPANSCADCVYRFNCCV